MYPLPAFITSPTLIPFTIEEITGCSNEVAKCANKAARDLPSCFFISYLTVPVTLSINTPEYFNNFVILWC